MFACVCGSVFVVSMSECVCGMWCTCGAYVVVCLRAYVGVCLRVIVCNCMSMYACTCVYM